MNAKTEIKCSCKICKVNAAHLGLMLPLRAEVPVALLEKCGGRRHGLVSAANDPTFQGAANDKIGLRPITASVA